MSPRLLIVENNAVIARDLKEIFTQPRQSLKDDRATINFQVDTAGNGAEAKDHLERAATGSRYDVVLLDLHLPATNHPDAEEGLDVANALIPELRGDVCAAVVFMSAYYKDPDTMATLIQSHAVDFISKPYTSDEVYWRVVRAYEQSQKLPPGRVSPVDTALKKVLTSPGIFFPESPHEFYTVHEAVMMVDCVQSSGLTAKFGNRAAAERKAAFERVVRNALSQSRPCSEPKDIGDGFFVTFPTEHDAVRCAIAILQDMPAVNAAVSRHELELHLRIGITFGELTVDARNERKGEAANLCARLESMQADDLVTDEGGLSQENFSDLRYDRILVSGEVYDGVKAAYPLRYVGLLKPKDIRRRYEVYLVDWQQLVPTQAAADKA